ncbi:helix-turn-helix domain-containing protein [Chryseobacterium sp.]|uniref:helix-turn-helix domain-containing protein n=1 Tax=Chryseobacterium sp. TaxID=1871047 RepID=UPI003219FF5C
MIDFSTELFLTADNGTQYVNTKSISDLLLLRSKELSIPHKTEFNVIYLFEEGEGQHTIDFNSINIKKRHILFVSQGQVTQFHTPPNYKGRVLIFTEDFFCRNNSLQTQFFGQTGLFNDPLNLPYFDLKERFDEVLCLFHFINEELQRPYHEKQPAIINNYLFNILLISEKLYDQKKVKLSVTDHKLLLSRFKSMVNRHIHQQYNLEFYVKSLNVSLRTLQAAFLQEEKQTPKQWLIDRMILEIKRNLTYQNKSISEIAYDLGFKEVTNFTKFFKSKTDLTPSQFRRLSSEQ